MRKIIFAAFAVAISAALPAFGEVSKDPAQAPTGVYGADAKHTQVLFSILHQGLTYFNGRFDNISGTLNFDGKQPERSQVSITIDTTSIDTPNAQLNGALKTVFRTQQYPTAIFKSTSVARTGTDTGRISGTLTIRDVTKPVILDVTFNGGGSALLSGGHSLGFHATGTIRRSDFGLDQMIWSRFVADDVQLVIEAQFDQQKS